MLHTARWKYQTQKWRKKSPSVHHHTTLSDYIFANKARINNRKKTCLLHMSAQYVELGPLPAEICWRVWGTPANFNGFCVLASLLQRRCSMEVNQTLHDVWLSPGLVHYIYILAAVALWLNFAMCTIHFVSKFCILLYWQRHCTALSRGRQPNQTLWHWEEGATYIRQGGHHVGHRPGSSSEIKWYRFWTTLCSLKPFAQMVSPKRPAGVGQTSVAQLECRVNVWQPLLEVLWQHGVLL